MMQPRFNSYRRSQGAILIVALVLLLAMTIIGVASIDNSTLQSQMSRNSLESNNRYQVGVNEIEAKVAYAAQSSDYRTDLLKGNAIANTQPGVTNSGNGFALSDTNTPDTGMITYDNTDPYTQSGYAVTPGFDTGAHHGFTIGQTRMMVIEFNIITSLNGTKSKTDLTQAALYTAPPDND